jgi:hypothetical protein
MSCSNLTAGLLDGCNDIAGGVEKLFIANGPVEAITASAGVVTAITVGGSALVPADFFVFELPRQTASFTEGITVSQENGTVVYNQDLTVIFNRLEAEKRNQIALMAQATSMVVVIKTNDGKYLSVGLEKGAFLGSATATTGTAYADRAGYELTISGIELTPSYEVTSTIVE